MRRFLLQIHIFPLASMIIGDSDVTSYAYGKPSSEGGGAQTVYSVIGWIDSAYCTITLAEPATGDLLTWLQKNAVKQ